MSGQKSTYDLMNELMALGSPPRPVAPHIQSLAEALVGTPRATSLRSPFDYSTPPSILPSPPQVYWIDANGFARTFTLYPVGSSLSVAEGIYVFAMFDYSRGCWVALYFGETDNFWRRVCCDLNSHHKFDFAKRLGATHIGIMPLAGGKRARTGVESDLLRANPTACND